MSMTVSVRLEYVNAKNYDFQRRHDMRACKKMPSYINAELSKNNEVIEKISLSGKELAELNNAQRMKAIKEGKSSVKQARKITPDMAVAFRQIITFGTDAQEHIRKLDNETQKKLYLAIAERIASEIGSKVLYVAIHRDEQAPHAHAMMNKYRQDGSAIRLNRQDLKRLQDIAGDVCKEFGLPITRGVPKEERVASGEPAYKYLHHSVRDLHYRLPKDIGDKEKKVEELNQNITSCRNRLDDIRKEIEELEKIRQKRLQDVSDKERLIAKALQELEDLKAIGKAESEKAAKLEKRIETYERRIENYEKEIAAKEKAISAKTEELDGVLKALDMYNKILEEKKEVIGRADKIVLENESLKRERKQFIEFVKHAERASRKCKPKGQELIASVFMTAAERSMCEFIINAVSKLFEDDLDEHAMKLFADR